MHKNMADCAQKMGEVHRLVKEGENSKVPKSTN